ncbi:MAG: hypothetical protein JO180_07345 [Gemmatirosa sp.]|nr:hypothetical protein [Gemmatirosa sp.]
MNVLFVGNSFTARNDVPGLLATLAAARGHTLTHRLISAGGASLRMHWNKGIARQAIEDGGWDWVVLQEQSTLPIKNATRFHENVRLFDAAVRAAGARMALYLTWARRHVPETQDVLTRAVTAIGAELGATVVPAGLAWQRVLALPNHPVLHDPDDSHPTLAGSYLAACTFLGTLFGESAVGLDGAGLDPADAALLQHAAWETVRGG